MLAAPLVRITPKGFYCEAGDFYIDPSGPVHRAVITHGHGDHARPGSRKYLAAASGEAILRTRLGNISLQTLAYNDPLTLGDTRISLHPAGHILGSAQVRIEHHGEVWVVSGDYKLQPDPTCTPFEPIACHTFVTESTFGLPIYQWPDTKLVIAKIQDWWHANQASGVASILLTYALGKAQRILSEIDATIGPIFTHPEIEKMNAAYRQSGVLLPHTHLFHASIPKSLLNQALILVPPSHANTRFIRTLSPASLGFTSGWAQTTKEHHRLHPDQSFILSDHADWPGLNRAIVATGAKRIYASHGSAASLADSLTKQGLWASTM